MKQKCCKGMWIIWCFSLYSQLGKDGHANKKPSAVLYKSTQWNTSKRCIKMEHTTTEF